MITPALIRRIRDEYLLEWDGIHGVSHWARVLENGLRLAKETNADVDVVRLFAVLHDSRRINDGHDPRHGERAAEFAEQVRGELFDLDDGRFALLRVACAQHTSGRTHADETVRTCWDADRLDLMRVGTMPHAKYLCTRAGKLPATIAWATERSERFHEPALVHEWSAA